MLATAMPFICMGAGLILGFQKLPSRVYRVVDRISTVALMVLMVTIGGNVGTNEEVVQQLGRVGVNCLLTCLFAILGSVFLCFVVEKTVIPLGRYGKDSTGYIDEVEAAALPEDADLQMRDSAKARKIDPILILIPICVIGGAAGCYLFLPANMTFLLDYSLWGSLIILYTGVGVGMGENRQVFSYMKKVGFRVVYLILGVYLGSILGGAASSLLTGMPLRYAVISASGSGYYSMTGATMLAAFGAEAGVYGFMVNVFRDFFTVLLLPILVRVSKSAPLASGGAGNMDTMLVPVTRACGREIGLIALIVGVALTFGVPVMLPVLCALFG